MMDAVAGARRTPERRKTEGAPKPPAATPLSVALSVLGLRFAQLKASFRSTVVAAALSVFGDVPVACCCGSVNLATLRRHIVSAVAAQSNSIAGLANGKHARG